MPYWLRLHVAWTKVCYYMPHNDQLKEFHPHWKINVLSYHWVTITSALGHFLRGLVLSVQ